MKKLGLLAGLLAVTLAAGSAPSFAAPAYGDFYVDAENGTDSATCGGASLAPPSLGPCATLNQALANASAGNTIVVVKGGTFGPIYLSGAISIVGPADKSLVIVADTTVNAGCIHTCSVGTSSGVYIQAAVTDTIQLKNMVVSAGTGATNAISIVSAFNVSLTNVSLRGGTSTQTTGILDVEPTFNLQLYLHNCDIGFSSTLAGVLVKPQGSSTASVNINNGEVHNVKAGVQIDATATTGSIIMAVDNTEFFSFNNSAVSIVGTSTGAAHATLARSTLLNSGGAALKVNGANASASLDQNLVTGNAVGVNIVGGAPVTTSGNNTISGNGTNCEVSSAPTACTSALTLTPQN